MRDVARADADLESLKAEDRCCADWTAHGQQKDDGKIGKGKHSAEDEADGHDRQNHRHDNLVVAPPETSAVDGRRIEYVLRDRRDAGEKDDNREREKTPG